MLEEPSIKIIRAWSAKKGEKQICEIPPPQLLLLDTSQPVGGWMEVLDAEGEAVEPVVSLPSAASMVNANLWLDTLDHGTFDLITGPFTVLRSGLC